MKLLVLVLGLVTIKGLAQNSNKSSKPSLDLSSLENWPSVGYNYSISNDGNYLFYTTDNNPQGNSILTVQSTNGNWKNDIRNAFPISFSADNKKIVYSENDTIFFQELGTNNFTYISDVISWKLPIGGDCEWLAYLLRKSTNELVLCNLVTGNKKYYTSIKNYVFDNFGKRLLLEAVEKNGETYSVKLDLVNLPSCSSSNIYSFNSKTDLNLSIDQYAFDTTDKIAFVVKSKEDSIYKNSIWYYDSKMDKSVLWINNQNKGIESGLVISDYIRFSNNGRWLFLKLLKPQDTSRPNEDATKVDVWSYKDVVLQSEQLSENPVFRRQNTEYFAVAKVNDQKVLRVEQDDENIMVSPERINGDHVVVSDKNNSVYWWNENAAKTFYLFSFNDQSRIIIKKAWASLFSFSPTGNYLVYYDNERRCYYCIDIRTQKKRNLSSNISTQLQNEYSYKTPGRIYPNPVGIAGWVDDGSNLLLYDNYDIWMADLNGNSRPINLTNGYGKANKIKFRLVNDDDRRDVIVSRSEELLLTSFNVVNKYNGFYSKSMQKTGDPKLLTMGPYTYYHKNSQLPVNSSELYNTIQPIKAKNSNAWILQRMSAVDAPNFFFTKDFTKFTPISNVQPQLKYNWLKTELISWSQPDGVLSQGIIYKPENFDAHKKYPIIFYYYESLSYRMYEYPSPELTEGPLNIPWFVSQGYLVFTPDIHFSIASLSNRTNGESAYNSIVSAAKYLSQLPWVDASRIGLQGHSFGGHETNYLITRSKIFAAAVEAAGVSDYVSSYLSSGGPLDRPSGDRQGGTEVGQGRMGVSFWERQDLYIRNSPIFNADKVTTPLLIMHNKADPAVPWGQGVELFLALRRLGKKVWMLQYDNGSHSVSGKDAVDFTIRINQFYDHYLKMALPPKWMTEGIPAKKKGIDNGLDIDPIGVCGKDCKVCNKANITMKIRDK